MRVVLASAFWNMEGRLPRYFEQIAALHRALLARGDVLTCVWGEGDSPDQTKRALLNYTGPVETVFVDVTHRRTVYGSVEHPERLLNLSENLNKILAMLPPCDYFLWVESDLYWTPDALCTLLDRVAAGYDMVAPLTFAGAPHYDVFCMRALDGSRFGPWPPYSDSLIGATGPVEVSTVGSCFAAKAAVAERCSVLNAQAVLGFCADVRANGFKIYCDPTVRIDHPV